MPPATVRKATSSGRVRLAGDDLLERLVVYWGASVVLLVCLLGVLSFLGVSRFRQHSAALREHAAVIESLRARLATVESGAELLRAELKAARGNVVGTKSSPAPVAPARVVDSRPARPDLRPPADGAGAAGPTAPTAPDVAGLLDKALDPRSPPGLRDRGAAQQALSAALGAENGDSVRGEDWARLAAIALLLGREDEAATHARRAALRGAPPHAYDELIVRRLLQGPDEKEALLAARKLAESPGAGVVSRLLLAEASLAVGDYAGADLAISAGLAAESFGLEDRVALGRVCIALERWSELRGALGALRDPPAGLQTEVNLLRGVEAVQREAHAEALAIFDSLVDSRRDDYLLQVWRGVALLRARQYDAARAALTDAAQQVGRPEAWHWLGALEMESGASDAASASLQRALGACRTHAPSWELLGAIALNAGDLAAALQNFANAAEVNPRRAVAHFLLSIVRAKLNQPEETASSLRAALRLDASLLAVARETPALQKMFAAEQLQALADGLEPSSQRASTP